MKKIALITGVLFIGATCVSYAEMGESYHQHRSGKFKTGTTLVEHVSTLDDQDTFKKTRNTHKVEGLMVDQVRQRLGSHASEMGTAQSEKLTLGTQRQSQKLHVLRNKALKMQSKPGFLGSLSIPETANKKLSQPKISHKEINMKTPKFRAHGDQLLGSGQGDRNIQSTNADMTNMQVKYMNRVLEGKIHYAVTQDR